MNVYKTNVTDSILGISVNDTTLDLFESQYPVPGGVSYNSYLIRDEKTAVMDTVDARATDLPIWKTSSPAPSRPAAASPSRTATPSAWAATPSTSSLPPWCTGPR